MSNKDEIQNFKLSESKFVISITCNIICNLCSLPDLAYYLAQRLYPPYYAILLFVYFDCLPYFWRDFSWGFKSGMVTLFEL